MTTEEEQFSEILKIAGFSLMTPLGSLFLGMPIFKLSNLTIVSFIYFLISLLLFFLGIILLLKSIEVLYKKQIKE